MVTDERHTEKRVGRLLIATALVGALGGGVTAWALENHNHQPPTQQSEASIQASDAERHDLLGIVGGIIAGIVVTETVVIGGGALISTYQAKQEAQNTK